MIGHILYSLCFSWATSAELEEAQNDNREMAAQLESAQDHINHLEKRIKDLKECHTTANEKLYEAEEALDD